MMKRLALATALLSFAAPALAQSSSSTQGSQPSTGSSGASSKADAASDPMAGYVPPKKVTPAQEKAAKKEIGQLFTKMEAAGKKGDLASAAALVDFPVLMLTDTKAGEALGEPWTEEQWKKVMEPFYAKPMEGMTTTHKPTVFMITQSLASVDDDWTMTMGKQKMTGRSSMLVVNKGGEWKIKAMVEGGWGDSMGEAVHGTASGSGSASDTGTGSSGTGSTTQPGSTSGTTGGTGSTSDTTGTGSTGSTGSTTGTTGSGATTEPGTTGSSTGTSDTGTSGSGSTSGGTGSSTETPPKK